MSNLWMAISPGPHATRMLGMTGPRDTILKACLAPSPAHPRAMATLLEAIALWQGSKVRGAFCVAEREWEFDSSLSREAFVDFGGPLYSLDWIAREPRARRRPRDLAEQLDPYLDFVRSTLAEHPRLRATRLLQMIQARGYAGSVWPLRRLVRRTRPVSPHEALFRLTTLPGEQAQVDWGSFGSIAIGNTRRALSCFVMVLSWSRALFARFVLDQSMESFLRCHVAAFERLGGVPRVLLYDNLETAVLERAGDIIRFHPRLLECAGHYHFAPRPVARARGNEKGRVERAIRYLRDSFFAARSFHSLEHLNAQLETWTEDIAHARLVPDDADKRVVRDALREEQPRLLPLPAHPSPTELVVANRSGKTPYLRSDANDYSIPHALVRKPLTLVASDTLVRVLDGDQEVARHLRSWERGRQLEAPAHLQGLSDDKRPRASTAAAIGRVQYTPVPRPFSVTSRSTADTSAAPPRGSCTSSTKSAQARSRPHSPKPSAAAHSPHTPSPT